MCGVCERQHLGQHKVCHSGLCGWCPFINLPKQRGRGSWCCRHRYSWPLQIGLVPLLNLLTRIYRIGCSRPICCYSGWLRRPPSANVVKKLFPGNLPVSKKTRLIRTTYTPRSQMREGVDRPRSHDDKTCVMVFLQPRQVAATPMNAPCREDLLALLISESSLRPDGNLTILRSFGVYRILRSFGASRRYRFGNHPVRRHELDREFSATKIEALFFERQVAQELVFNCNNIRI